MEYLFRQTKHIGFVSRVIDIHEEQKVQESSSEYYELHALCTEGS